MKVSLVPMDKFLQENGSSFPYNRLKSTRRRFIVKYLILQSVAGNNSMPHYYVVPSSSFNADTVQSLLFTKQALPCVEEWNSMVETMVMWGRSVSESWYQSVISFVAYHLRVGFTERVENVYHDCIQFRLTEMVFKAGLHVNTELAIFGRAIDHYHHMYHHQTRSFKWLAMKSFQFVGCLIQESLMDAAAQEPGASIDDENHSDIIPVSPVSSSSF